MEGKLDQKTGEYTVSWEREVDDAVVEEEIKVEADEHPEQKT